MKTIEAWEALNRQFMRLDELEQSIGRLRDKAENARSTQLQTLLSAVQTKIARIDALLNACSNLTAENKTKLMAAAKPPQTEQEEKELLATISRLNYDLDARDIPGSESLYYSCCCEKKYLIARQRLIEQRVEESINQAVGPMMTQLKTEYDEQRRWISHSVSEGAFHETLMSEFANCDVSAASFPLPEADAEEISLWSELVPVAAKRKQQIDLSALSSFYSAQKNCLLLPFGVSVHDPFTLTIHCEKQEDREVRDFALCLCMRLLRTMQPLENRVIFLDGSSHNPDNWRCPNGSPFLGALADEHGFVRFPTAPAEERFALEKLERMNPAVRLAKSAAQPEATVFDKMDRKKPDDKARLGAPRLLIAYGYPNRLSREAVSQIDHLIGNSDASGVSVVLITESGHTLQREERLTTDYTIVVGKDGKTVLHERSGASREVVLPAFDCGGLALEMIENILKQYTKADELVSEKFWDRVLFPTEVPARKPARERFHAALPFAVNKANGRLSGLELDLGDHAYAYFAAPAGAGKTSALHMMIASLLTRFHPDDLELWLLDLKGVEFNAYEKAAPHVRYVLSSGDPEVGKRYVIDILDRLEREKINRSRLCSDFGVQDVSQLPDEVYCPMLVAILDEYAVVDEMIEQNLSYSRKLQNLLRQGRAMGIFLIFSSQSFDKSAMGATVQNIQTRIGMFHPNSTQGGSFFPSGMPKVNIGQNSLPRFHSVLATRQAGGETAVFLHHLRFEKEKDLPALLKLLETVRRYEAVESDDGKLPDPGKKEQYIRRAVGTISPSSVYPFETYRREFPKANEACRRNMDDPSVHQLHVGKPCSFAKTRSIKLNALRKENLLAVINAYASSEYPGLAAESAASLLFSAQMDGLETELWTTATNRHYQLGKRRPGAELWQGVRVYTENNVADRIRALTEEIRAGDCLPRLVVILDLYELAEELVERERARPAPETITQKAGAGGASPSAAPVTTDAQDPDDEDDDDDTAGLVGIFNSFKSELEGTAGSAEKSTPDLLETLHTLITDAPRKGIHFVVHVNEFEELERVSALCSNAAGIYPAFRLRGYRHLLTGTVTENKADVPFLGLRMNLPEGLLFYSCEGSAVIYNAFDFQLHRNTRALIGSEYE